MTINCRTCGTLIEMPERPPLSIWFEGQCGRCGAVNDAIVSYPRGLATATGRLAFPWLPQPFAVTTFIRSR